MPVLETRTIIRRIVFLLPVVAAFAGFSLAQDTTTPTRPSEAECTAASTYQPVVKAMSFIKQRERRKSRRMNACTYNLSYSPIRKFQSFSAGCYGRPLPDGYAQSESSTTSGSTGQQQGTCSIQSPQLTGGLRWPLHFNNKGKHLADK